MPVSTYHAFFVILGISDFTVFRCKHIFRINKMLEKCANIWVFLTIFCLCYFLETITFTYLISAIQSIEKQFQIPSSKSGALVSANDIGYVLTVVILAYIGSKGNRARFIGGGCLLISFACLLISSTHFIFPHQEMATNSSMVKDLMKPPAYLRAGNVTPEQILNYPPFKKRLPKSAFDFLMVKAKGEEQEEESAFGGLFDYLGGSDYPDYSKEESSKVSTNSKTIDVPVPGKLDTPLSSNITSPDYESEYYTLNDEELIPPNLMGSDPGILTRAKRQMGAKPPKELIEMFIEVKLGSRNASDLFDYVKVMLNKGPSEKAVAAVQRAAGMPFGYCNPIINTMKGKLAELKCGFNQVNEGAFAIVFIGIMLIGVGHSMPWSLGVPLIDDNIKKRSAPLYFAGIFFIRILGPVLGFLIGSACSRLYFTLKNPGLMPMDPRWIGAWWLGFLIICVSLFFPSLLLFFFPSKGVPKSPEKGPPGAIGDKQENGKQIEMEPQAKSTIVKQKTEREKASINLVDVHKAKDEERTILHELKGFFTSLFVVLKSPVYTGALIGRLFDAFAFKGFFVFLPKYLESHFGLPQYKANMFLGIMGVFGFASGVVVGSLIMKRFKLEGRKAAAWVGICSLISSILFFSKIGLGCHSVVNSVGRIGQTKGFNFTETCNANCNCGPISLSPVCDAAGNPYYSSCAAGCTNMTVIDRAAFKFSFADCKCVDKKISPEQSVSRENCKDDCTSPMIGYFALSVLSGIISGSSVIPGVLIVLRSVPPEFRSVALGFSGFLVSMLSTFPSPIVYGSLIDGACLLWTNTCGKKGSCRIYDPDVLRYKMHGFNGALRIGGLIFDIWVLYWAKGLKLMEEEDVPENDEANREETESPIATDLKAMGSQPPDFGSQLSM